MLIDYEIFKWLVESNIIPRPEKPNVRADTKVELDESTSRLVQNGLIFVKIIRILKRQAQSVSKLPLQTPPNLKQLKDANTPGARVYNWNIVAEALAKLNYRVDNDIKSLIIAGDEDMALEVLKEVYRIIMKFNKLAGKEKPSSTASSVDSAHDLMDRLNYRFPNKNLAENMLGPSHYTKQVNTYKALHSKAGPVDLDYIDIDTPIEDTMSIMELLIVSLSKALSLNSKQSMALLVNGNKYLAHVLAKGIKGNFEPVIYWYKELYAQSKHILQLVIKEESTGSVPTILQALKPGLYSKNEEVAQWTCRFLSKIAFDFSNVELLPAAWEWFTAVNGGLYAFFACLKRHPDTGPYVVAGITQFGRYNMLELFTVEMKKIFVDPLEYIQTMLLMLKPLTEAKFTKDELLNSSIVDFLLELGLKNADSLDRSATPQLRTAALFKRLQALLCDLWELYPTKIEEQEGLPNQILIMLKKGIRDNYNSLKVVSITYLFRLLENFASERNPFAPIVYKILTFSLIENHEDQSFREQILLNFITIFKNFSSIPVGVLLEPLAKQIQVSEGSTYHLNLFDLNALDVLANHPKLTLKQGILLLDVLAKVYLNNVSFAYLAGPPLLKIVERFIEEDTMQEYLLEFSKLALSKYYTSVKRKKTKDNFVKKFVYLEDRDDLYVGPTHITPEMEQEILNAQKRSLTINILRDIVNFQSSILNAKYKTLFAYTNAQIKQLTRHDNKGMKFLLSLFGDADEIIRDYEQENQPSHDKKMVDHHQIPASEYIAPQEEGQTSPVRGSQASLQYSERQMEAKNEVKSEKSPSVRSSVAKIREIREDQKFDLLKLDDNEDELFQKKGSAGSLQQNNRYDTKKDIWDEDIGRSNVLSLGNGEQESRVIEGHNKTKAKEIHESKKKEKGVKDAARFMRALEEIEGIKKKKKEEKMTQEMLEEYKKLKEEKTKEVLKKKIDQRRMELGVQAKANNFIRDEQSEERFIQPSKKKTNDIENMMVVDFDDEEYFQKEAITIYIKQNIRKFKYLFNKYCVTGASYQKEKMFDKLRVQFNTINQVALLRLVKDNGLHHVINKEEIAHLFRLVNTKLLNNEDFHPLNFEGFVKFMTQLGIYIYTRPPLDHANPNYVDCVKKLMFVIYLSAQGRGEHKQMMEEGQNLGEADKYELDSLNRQIQDNPNMGLPSGYRRVIENNVDFSFKMPASLQIPPGYKAAYEILDEILHQQFGFHIMESKAIFSTNIKVAPMVRHDVASNIRGRQVHENRDLSESRGKSNDFELKKRGNRSNREISVDRTYGEKRIINRAIEEKMRKEEEERKRKYEHDQKIRKRQMEIKEKMKELAVSKKEKELKKEEEKQMEFKEKDEYDRLKEEKRRKELEKKKQMVENYRERKELEAKKREEYEREQNLKKLEQRREQKELLKKQTESLQKMLENQSKKREEDEKQQSQKQVEEKKKEVQQKKHKEANLEKERERREKEKETNEQLIQLHQSPIKQAFYNQNSKTLNAVFKHYKENPERDVMSFKEFMTLGAQLNLFPSLVSSSELKLIFRSLTRDKKGEIGLSYNDFLQSLLRISIKSQQVLNRIAEKFPSNKESSLNPNQTIRDVMNQAKQEMGLQTLTKEQAWAIQKGENYERNNVDKDTEDSYQGIAGTKRETLDGLMVYLDLPTEPMKLKDKLRSLRIENQKIIAPRDKKRVAIQSAGIDMRSVSPNVRSPGPNKNNSAGVKVSPNSSKGNLKNQILPPINKKDKGQKTLPNTQSSQNVNRQNVNNSPYVSNSQNKQENSPYEGSQSPVKEEKDNLVAVEARDLSEASPERESEIVAPDGKKEKWSVKSLFGKKK